MPIIIAIVFLGALIFGAVYFFNALATHFGHAIAIGIFACGAILILGLITYWVQRYRDIAPNTKEGDWTHKLTHASGSLFLSTTQGLLWLRSNNTDGHYTFSDLRDCLIEEKNSCWYLIVKVHDSTRPEWKLTMPNKRQAKRWARILRLAQIQKL